MIDQIKNLRVNIDSLFKTISTLNRTRETSLAITSLQLSKMWLGKVLAELGNDNPYPESKNPLSSVIENTADEGARFQYTTKDGEFYDIVQTIKALRSEVDYNVKQLDWNKEYSDGYSEWKKDEKLILALRTSQQYLVEGGMWLGMELSNHKTN